MYPCGLAYAPPPPCADCDLATHALALHILSPGVAVLRLIQQVLQALLELRTWDTTPVHMKLYSKRRGCCTLRVQAAFCVREAVNAGGSHVHS